MTLKIITYQLICTLLILNNQVLYIYLIYFRHHHNIVIFHNFPMYQIVVFCASTVKEIQA